MFVKIINPTLLLFLPIILVAQEPLSLDQAITKGLENNYQIQIAQKNTQIASNNNDWGTAGKHPSIDVFVNSQNSYTDQTNPASVLQEASIFSPSLTPSLELNWTLYNGSRIKITKQQLEELEKQAEGFAQIPVENTVQTVILAYYEARIRLEQLNVLEEVLDLSRDRVVYQETRREFGQASTFDLLQTQDAYLSDSTNYVIQENLYQTALRNLNLAMGLDDFSQQFTLTNSLEFDLPDYNLDELKQEMQANNVTLKNLFINRQLANINTQLQETAKRPVVSLNTGASYGISYSNGNQVFNFSGMESPREIDWARTNTFNYHLNITASYNLYNGGVRKRNIENAQVQEMMAQLDIEEEKRQLNAQLENTLANYNSQLHSLRITESLIENARQNLDIAKERFDRGLINSFDYRTIQVNFINASQARLNALFNLKNTETELLRLTGSLVK